MPCATRKTKQGFTLIEMLVVILIIGVLSAALLPALTKARRQARRAHCMSNLKQIGHAVNMFIHDDDEAKLGRYVDVAPWRYLYAWHLWANLYPGAPGAGAHQNIEAADPSIARWFQFFQTNPDGSQAPVYDSQGIGKLYPDYIPDPEVFYCPGSDTWTPMSGWPASDLNCYITYQSREAGAVGPTGRVYYGVVPLTERKWERVSLLSCSTWRGECAHEHGWNVWFLDGSCNWYKDDDVIRDLGDEEWFQSVAGIPKVGRPSPWTHFDLWKEALPASELP